jgi:hypothetical protein
MPGILVSHLSDETGTEPTVENMPTFIADQLRATGEGDPDKLTGSPLVTF